MKQAKKIIAIMLAFVFVLSLLPLGVFAAEQTVQITGDKKIVGEMRGGDKLNSVNKASNDLIARCSSDNGRRIPYLQYNVSEYVRYLSSANFVFSIQHGGTDTSTKANAYNLYLLKGDYVDDSGTPVSTLTLNKLVASGAATTKKNSSGTISYNLNPDSTDLIKIGSFSGSNRTDTQYSVSAEDIKSAVSSNGWVTFIIDSTATTSTLTYFRGTNANTYLEITYDDSAAASDQDILDDILDGIQWSDLSDDDIASVVNALPTEYKGANIEWSSEPEGVINADGTINAGIAEQSATLFANFSYSSGSGEPGTASIEFEVTIGKKPPKTIKIPFINAANTRDRDANSFVALKNNADITDAVVSRYGGTDNIYYGYFQADLSGYEEILHNPNTKITLDLSCGGGSAAYPAGDYQLVLFPDRMDGYDHTAITHNYAKNNGMQDASNGVIIHEDSDGVANNRKDISLEIDIQTYLTALDAGINGKLTFGIIPLETTRSTIGHFFPLKEASGLTISYYDEEIEDEEYFAELEDNFTWQAITDDAEGVLINDLPTYYKGARIAWESNNNTVTESGKVVAVPGEITADTITATVLYKDYGFTKEFNVNVCDGNLVLGQPTLTVDGGVATASISVINGTGKDVSYQLYLAIYNGNEMTAIVPFTLDVTKGSEGSKILTAASGSKAKFFVWEADGITPVRVSLEK